LTLLALIINLIQIKLFDHVLVAENKLVDAAAQNGRPSLALLSALEKNDGRQLLADRRGAHAKLGGHVRKQIAVELGELEVIQAAELDRDVRKDRIQVAALLGPRGVEADEPRDSRVCVYFVFEVAGAQVKDVVGTDEGRLGKEHKLQEPG